MPELTAGQLVQLARQHINADLLDEAIKAGQQAIAVEPGYIDAYFLLGVAYLLQERRAEALDCYARVLAAVPDHIAIDHVIYMLEAKGAYEDLIPFISNSLKASHNQPGMWSNLCLYLSKAGHTRLAIDAGRVAVQLQPELAEAHWNLGQALLRNGDFAEGWAEYEWRRQLRIFGERNQLHLGLPWWEGRPLDGRRLLVIAEQGAGDAFQFSRFIPLLKKMGGIITVAADAPLLPVLATVPGVDHVMDRWSASINTESFDCQAYLLSLPYLLGLEGPAPMQPYLFALPGRVALMAAHLHRQIDSNPLKVGLVWAGNPEHGNDLHRSLPLQAFAPLAAIPGIQFFSLQKGEAAQQCQTAACGLRIVDLSANLHDFADTAAAISLLDLVICVDTSVAHLAGALGRQVWTLLPEKDVDWRWLDGHQDSPWYPGMRLFRQVTDRQAVMTQLAAALWQELQARAC